MIEDLFEVENICDKFDIEIDETIKDMYKTLCLDNKFSALTEIKIYLDLSYRTEFNYNTTYNYYYNNYGLDNNKFYFYIYILDHTTFLPIYRIDIKTVAVHLAEIQKEQDTIDDIANEIYTISIYQIKKVGIGKLIKNRLADKNSLKEIIQGCFKSLTKEK